MTLPIPHKDDARWKLAQTIASIVLVALQIYHSHAAVADRFDLLGLAGDAVGVKLLVQLFKKRTV